MPMPRMRLIKEAIAYVKTNDPETALTEHALKQMVFDRTIPHIRAGNKYLINLDILDDYLAHPDRYEQNPNDFGKIRKLG